MENQEPKKTEKKEKKIILNEKINIPSILSELEKIEGIKIDMIGTWFWVSGKTKENSDKLANIKGLHYSGKQKKWYFSEHLKPFCKASKYKFHELKEKYGYLELQKEKD